MAKFRGNVRFYGATGIGLQVVAHGLPRQGPHFAHKRPMWGSIKCESDFQRRAAIVFTQSPAVQVIVEYGLELVEQKISHDSGSHDNDGKTTSAAASFGR